MWKEEIRNMSYSKTQIRGISTSNAVKMYKCMPLIFFRLCSDNHSNTNNKKKCQTSQCWTTLSKFAPRWKGYYLLVS